MGFKEEKKKVHLRDTGKVRASREGEVNTNGAETQTTKDPFCPGVQGSGGTVSHSDGVRGARGSPKARSFVRPRRGAGQGCALRPGAAPDRGPLPRAAPQRQASLRRCPRHLPSPFPATFPGLASPLSSTQKLQARRLLSTAPIFPPTARARGPHRRPAARGRAGEEPGRPPQRRVCTLMLSAAGRRKKRAHVRALARRSGPGSRDASACPHAAASSRGAPRPPRGASFSLFLSQRRRDPPRGRRRLPARPTPPPQRAAAGPREPQPPRALTPRGAPARWASRAPPG